VGSTAKETPKEKETRIMAEILEDYKFPRYSKYPFDEWFDGQIRELVMGIDFDVPIPSMRASIYNAAFRKHLRVRTHVTASGTLIVEGLRGKKDPDWHEDRRDNP
tara:strand:+ start:713 stop:1027 length:315 start_codon:yes stop_codon:yes gene_type:complete